MFSPEYIGRRLVVPTDATWNSSWAAVGSLGRCGGSFTHSLSLALNRTPNDIRREQNNRRWQSRPKPPLLVSFEQFKWFLMEAEKSLFNSLPPKAYLKYRNWTFRSQIWKKFCFKVTWQIKYNLKKSKIGSFVAFKAEVWFLARQ